MGLRVLVLLLCSLWGAVFAADQAKPLIFGVLNQQSPAKTAQRWNPILKYLSDATGMSFELRMGATVAETDAMMERGEFDLAFTNHNFQRRYDGQYQVLARWAGKPIFGVVAVLADSPVRNLKDLAGKRVAFPSKDAFVAYAVPMLAMQQARVTPVAVFAGNQEGALAQLKAGQVAAAAANSRFLTQYAALQGLHYREIFTSQGYADLPVIAHKRMSRESVEVLRRALLTMADDPRAAPVLESVGFAGFEPATEKDYEVQRRVYRQMRTP